MRMKNIDTETRKYRANDGGALAGTEQGEKMLANFMASQELVLKIGAQVSVLHLSIISWSLDARNTGYVDQEHGRDACQRQYGHCRRVR